MPVPEERFYTFVEARNCLAYMSDPIGLDEIIDFYIIASRGDDAAWFAALSHIAGRAETWLTTATPSGGQTQQSVEKARLRAAQRFVDTVRGGASGG